MILTVPRAQRNQTSLTHALHQEALATWPGPEASCYTSTPPWTELPCRASWWGNPEVWHSAGS
jgi:hypothetical protein